MFNFKFLCRKIWKQINHSQNILLHIHPGPDGDSVGSSLAFYHVLKNLGKNVVLIQGDNQLPQNLRNIPGADKITPQNIFQIDLNLFDLFIINDASSYRQISRLGEIKFPKKLNTVIIDHHITNEKFAKINLVLPKFSSTSQVLYDFFRVNKIKINKKIAACLYIGIYTDTGGFKYSTVNYKTLNIASILAKIYPKFTQLIFDIENSDEPDRLRFISLLLISIENYFSNHVAIASLSHEDIKKNNLNVNSLNGSSEISNMLKSVIGWNIVATLIEINPGIVKVSLRTRDGNKYDLSKIAIDTKTGGGHKSAAGCTLNQSLPQAKQTLLSIIKKIYPKIDK